MRNTPNQTKNRKKRPAWVEMFAKTRSVESDSSGRDWHTDVPNIRLSRAFVVVLVLHVVAVGGILAFEMFKPDNTAEVTKTKGDTNKVTADAPAAPAAKTPATPAAKRDADLGGYERYIVQAGDSIRHIADRYRIARTELLSANRIDEQHPLVAGRILRIPKALLPGGSSSNLQPVSADNGPRPELPQVTSTLSNGVLVQETTPSALDIPEVREPAEDDGFVSLGGSAEAPKPEDNKPAQEVVRSDDGYVPANVNREEEDATPRIVAPRANKPRVSRNLPTADRAQPVREQIPAAGGRTHNVAAGETLYRISRKYGVSVDAILNANPGTKASSLSIGKALRIP